MMENMRVGFETILLSVNQTKQVIQQEFVK